MSSYNYVSLLGNLVRDPEMRIIPNGTPLCQFGLAVNRSFSGADGTKREEVLFIDIEAWGKQGELVQKYLHKGSQCLVIGRLKLDSWEDKATLQKRTKIKIVMQEIVFLGQPGGRAAPASTAALDASARKYPALREPDDADVPF